MEPSFQTDFLWHLAYLKTCIYKTLQIMIQKLTPPPFFFFFLSWTEELTKAGTCARDRRALQQLALNVHVKHSDLTWLRMMVIICLPLVGLGTVQDVCCAVSICHDTIKLTFWHYKINFFSFWQKSFSFWGWGWVCVWVSFFKLVIFKNWSLPPLRAIENCKHNTDMSLTNNDTSCSPLKKN